MKKLLSFILSTLFIFPIFALPGFVSYLPDNSGDYVFYRDNSFERESYIGFLSYDDNTLQVKYFAPKDNDKKLLEKNIAVLFSINPEKDYMELTGEKIISQITPDDVDIVNYLHDIIYEFSARRIKADPVSPQNPDYKSDKSFWENGLSISQEYTQFGGKVSVIFDATVPVFNVKRIIDNTGNDILSLVTFGTLASSSDSSFDNFKGISNKTKGSNKKISKAKAVSYDYNNINIKLDENWKQGMENLWLLDDSALVAVNHIPENKSFSDRYDAFVLRRLLMSSQDSYVFVPSISIKKQKDGYIINSDIVQKSGKIYKNFKILKRENSDSFNLILLNIFSPDYLSNRKYFDSLIQGN